MSARDQFTSPQLLSPEGVRVFALAVLLTFPLISMATTTCPEGIGALEGAAPIREFRLDAGSKLLVCGFGEKTANGRMMYSEFELIAASTRNLVLRFGATDQVRIEKRRGQLVLVEHHPYPLGKNWSVIPVAYRQIRVSADGKGGYNKVSRLVMSVPKFSQKQLADIRGQYQRAMTTGLVRDGLPSLVVLAALSGNSEFRELLNSARTDLKLDGALGEEYSAALVDFEELTGVSK